MNGNVPTEDPFEEVYGNVGADVTDDGEPDPRETPVNPARCLWCKVPMSEADVDLRYHELDTGEVICKHCLGDARHFKRTVHVNAVASVLYNDVEEGLTADITAAMMDAADEVIAERTGEQVLTPSESFTSNASGRVEHDTDEESDEVDP